MSGRERARLVLLRGLGRLLPRAVAQPLPSSPRLLVVRPDHIGDFLFMLPAIRELAGSGAKLTLAVGPWVAPLAAATGVEAETVPFPGFRRRARRNLAAPYAQAAALARAWSGRYDAALIARPDHWWGAMTARLAGVGHIIGRRTPETAAFLTLALPAGEREHEVMANVALARAALAHLGLPHPDGPVTPETHPLRLGVAPADDEAAANWLRRNLGTERGFICLHPGAGAANKLWPLRRYQSLVRSLVARTGRPVVVTGGLAEVDLATQVAAVSPEAVPAAGEFSLPGLAALLARAALAAGSDSGPLHLAVAAGTPTVHVFGPADEAKFGPWGARERHPVLTAPVACRPCGDLLHCRAADHLACMRRVGVEQVLAACLDVLARDGAAPL